MHDPIHKYGFVSDFPHLLLGVKGRYIFEGFI